MAAELNGNNNFRYGFADSLAKEDVPAITKTTMQALGSQEEMRKQIESIEDQFISAQDGLVGQAAAAKREALQKVIAGRLFKHFFTVYETGFALAQQWSDMEANV
jgi:hypothetical protein